jgi:hypothetical protein
MHPSPHFFQGNDTPLLGGLDGAVDGRQRRLVLVFENGA